MLNDKKISINYGNHFIEKYMLSSDQIIIRWSEDRRNISRSISNERFDFWDYNIPYSEKCECKACDISCKNGVCLGCEIVSRLFKDGIILLDQTKKLNIGIFIGLQFSIFKTLGSSPVNPYSPYVIRSDIKEKNKNIMNKYTSHDDDYNEDLYFLACGGTHIEHYSLVSSIIEYEMNKIEIPCIPTFMWTWACSGDIYTVNKVCDLGNGTFKLAENIHTTCGILGQLFSIMHFNLLYLYTHNAPSMKSVCFSNNPCNYKYMDVEISSPITMHIIPSGFTSVSIGSDSKTIRLFHPGMSDLIVYDDVSTIEISSHKFDTDVVCYKIGSDIERFKYYTRNLASTLFLSYDIYAFFTAFICNKLFYNNILRNKNFFEIWESLFLQSEFSDLMQELDKIRMSDEEPSSDKILKILSKYTLRSDSVDHCWNKYVKI